MKQFRLYFLLTLLFTGNTLLPAQDFTSRVLSFSGENMVDSISHAIDVVLGNNREIYIPEIKKAIQTSIRKKKWETTGHLYRFLAQFEYEDQQFSNSESSSDSSIKYFQLAKNDLYEAMSVDDKAHLYRTTLRTKEALEILFGYLKKFSGNNQIEFMLSSSIAGIFNDTKNTRQSFQYFKQAERKFARIKNPNSENMQVIISLYKSLGIFYREEKKLDTALLYFNKALEMAIATNDEIRIAAVYNSLGIFYIEQKIYDKAIDYLNRSMELKVKRGDSLAAANSMNNLSAAYIEQKQYGKAEKLLLRARRIFNLYQTDNSRYIHTLSNLAEVYAAQKKPLEAYTLLKEAYQLKDTLYEEGAAADGARMEAIFENEKKSREIEVSNIKNKELKKNLDLQDKQNTYLLIGLSILGLLLLWAVWSYIGKRRAHRQLEEKNTEIVRQKALVEEQHKEIVDSINYAQKIQSAILPPAEDFMKALGNCFIFFKPKDIVSGDFYWMTEKGDSIFYATVDCTGHGVPGGFMSVLAASLLNEIVNENDLNQPDDILNTLRIRVIQALKQKGESGENKDGMDMVLCRINKKTKYLDFAAANNPVWIARGNEMLELKADKFPVGISPYENMPFSLQKIQLQAGDTVYTFTDGYADQFGGEKGKKFKYSNLQKLLLDHKNLSPAEQWQTLDNTFMDWKGNLEQVDDVCVIGVRV